MSESIVRIDGEPAVGILRAIPFDKHGQRAGVAVIKDDETGCVGHHGRAERYIRRAPDDRAGIGQYPRPPFFVDFLPMGTSERAKPATTDATPRPSRPGRFRRRSVHGRAEGNE